MRYTIFCLVLLCNLSLCWSQHETEYNTWINNSIVILKTQDTLAGTIKFHLPPGNTSFSSNQIVAYKEDGDSKKKKIKAIEISEVLLLNKGHDTIRYRSVRVSEKRHWLLQILIENHCSLYSRYYYGNSSVSTGSVSLSGYNFYAMKKGDDIVFDLSTSLEGSFRKKSMEFFNSCPELVEKIKNRILKKEDAIEIVTRYNDCAQ